MSFIYLSQGVTFCFGVYDCKRCGKVYTVNEKWSECTPEFCHDCTEYLSALYALVPWPEREH